MIRFIRIIALSIVLTLVPIMASALEPIYGTATVDGNPGEWDLTNDFFANMYRAAKTDKQTESKLYLRYDCQTKTLYALVLAEAGVDVLVEPDDAFIKLGNNDKLVDGNYSTFEWIGEKQDGTAQGWEASAQLDPGYYSNLNVHTQVFSGGEAQTSAVADREIPITIECQQDGDVTITKMQKFKDDLNDAWTVDPLFGVESGDTISYLLSVAPDMDYDSLTFLEVSDVLSEFVEYTDNLFVEKVDKDGSFIADVSNYFSYDNSTFSLDLASLPNFSLSATDSLQFSFDVMVKNGFDPGMVIMNQAEVAFAAGQDPKKSNIVKAFPDPGTVVPEPATVFLLGIGLLGILGLSKKYRKR